MRHVSLVFAALLWAANQFKPFPLLAACGLAFTPLSTQAQTCAPPPPGMVAWWPGDGNTNDIAGSNPGTLRNGATFGVGRVGSAFSFDGVDDGISILKTSGLDMGKSDFTIDAWVNFTQVVGPFGPIFINYAGVPAYSLVVSKDSRAQVSFRPGVAITGSGSDPNVAATGTSVLNDGKWHHLAGVRKGTTVLIYVDGALEGSASNPLLLSVNGGSVDTSGCRYARIGAIHTGPGHCTSLDPNPAEPRFKGLIDEVEVFNRALTQPEIKAIYNAGSAGKCKPKKGMTWIQGKSDATTGTITVGCSGCDAYHGDTVCTELRPLLCIYKPKPPFQLPKGLDNSDQYNRWSGGVVATTQPVAGMDIKAANSYCDGKFGPGWRAAEFHDGEIWNFQAYGGTVNPPTVPPKRFWVYINDQPDGNCK